MTTLAPEGLLYRGISRMAFPPDLLEFGTLDYNNDSDDEEEGETEGQKKGTLLVDMCLSASDDEGAEILKALLPREEQILPQELLEKLQKDFEQALGAAVFGQSVILQNIPQDTPKERVEALIKEQQWHTPCSLRKVRKVVYGDSRDDWLASFKTKRQENDALEKGRDMKFEGIEIVCKANDYFVVEIDQEYRKKGPRINLHQKVEHSKPDGSKPEEEKTQVKDERHSSVRVRAKITFDRVAHEPSTVWGWVGTPGLKWKEVGSEKPQEGREIDNEALAEALMDKKMQFSLNELVAFKISLNPGLSYDCYIKAGDQYFAPDGTDQQIKVGSDKGQTTTKAESERRSLNAALQKIGLIVNELRTRQASRWTTFTNKGSVKFAKDDFKSKDIKFRDTCRGYVEFAFSSATPGQNDMTMAPV